VNTIELQFIVLICMPSSEYDWDACK